MIPAPGHPVRRLGGHRACIAACVLLALAVLAAHLAVTIRHTDRCLMTYDSAEYAVAGRQLSRTGVLATPFVHPTEVRAGERAPFPLLVGHPMVPVLDAAAFSLLGERPDLTLLPAALTYLLVVGLGVALAAAASGSPGIAAVVGVALAFHPRMLYFASEGASEMPFTAAWTAAFLLLWRLPVRPHPWLLGLALGAAHFTRPIVAPVLPAWLVGAALLAPAGRRWRTVFAVFGGFLPWALAILAYKLAYTGSPFTDVGPLRLLTHLAPEFTNERLIRYVDLPGAWSYVATHPGALLGKIVRFGPRMAAAALTTPAPSFGLLFLVYLFSRASGAWEKRFGGTVVGLLALLAALATLTVPSPRYFFPFIPVILALGLTGFFAALRRRGLWAGAALSFCLALVAVECIVPTVRGWASTWTHRTRDRGVFTESEWSSFGARLRELLPTEGVVASDVAPWVSWYADRPSVLLPLSLADTETLGRRLPIQALVLTNEYLVQRPGSEEWLALDEGRLTAARWARVDTIVSGKLRATVLLRRGAAGR